MSGGDRNRFRRLRSVLSVLCCVQLAVGQHLECPISSFATFGTQLAGNRRSSGDLAGGCGR